MKTTVHENDFIKAFSSNETYKDKFTVAGLRALFAYLESLEQGWRKEIELDVVSLACEYTQYESLQEAMEVYEEGFTPDMGDNENPDVVEIEEAAQAQIRKYLEERTTVIDVDGCGVIIQNF